jgi:hypothetical protein
MRSGEYRGDVFGELAAGAAEARAVPEVDGGR